MTKHAMLVAWEHYTTGFLSFPWEHHWFAYGTRKFTSSWRNPLTPWKPAIYRKQINDDDIPANYEYPSFGVLLNPNQTLNKQQCMVLLSKSLLREKLFCSLYELGSHNSEFPNSKTWTTAITATTEGNGSKMFTIFILVFYGPLTTLCFRNLLGAFNILLILSQGLVLVKDLEYVLSNQCGNCSSHV